MFAGKSKGPPSTQIHTSRFAAAGSGLGRLHAPPGQTSTVQPCISRTQHARMRTSLSNTDELMVVPSEASRLPSNTNGVVSFDFHASCSRDSPWRKPLKTTCFAAGSYVTGSAQNMSPPVRGRDGIPHSPTSQSSISISGTPWLQPPSACMPSQKKATSPSKNLLARQPALIPSTCPAAWWRLQKRFVNPITNTEFRGVNPSLSSSRSACVAGSEQLAHTSTHMVQFNEGIEVETAVVWRPYHLRAHSVGRLMHLPTQLEACRCFCQ